MTYLLVSWLFYETISLIFLKDQYFLAEEMKPDFYAPIQLKKWREWCFFLFVGNDSLKRAVICSNSKKIEDLWKKLLLNQFHDVLPGSSIKLVRLFVFIYTLSSYTVYITDSFAILQIRAFVNTEMLSFTPTIILKKVW